MDPDSPLLQTLLENRAALLRYFALRLRSQDAADDLLHDLYIRIAALPANTRVENPLAYLFSAGRNILLNHLRQSQRTQKRDEDWMANRVDVVGHEPIESGPSAEAETAARQELSRAFELLKALPDQTQRIFRLHRIDGLTQLQIATQLSVSKRTVETHLSTALKHLLKHMPRAP